jgi:hypothetical protein
MSPNDLWQFLIPGYLLTILIETTILVVGLSPRHSLGRKLFAGVWLTASTYPIVVLVLPLLFTRTSRTTYVIVAETFAPLAECLLFWLAFGRKGGTQLRDLGAIVLANLTSFAFGEVLASYGWFGLFG